MVERLRAMNCHLVRKSQFRGNRAQIEARTHAPAKLVLAYQLDKNGEAPLPIARKQRFLDCPLAKGDSFLLQKLFFLERKACFSSSAKRLDDNGTSRTSVSPQLATRLQFLNWSKSVSNTYKSAFRKGCPTAIGFNRHGNIRPIYCGKWACERCSRHNARMWAWRVFIGVENAGGTVWMWTLTMRGSIQTQAYAYKILPKLWDTFRKALQRAFGGAFTYAAFVEGQPKRNHMPHFHIVSYRKAPKRLKDMAVKAGFGHQAKEKPIQSKGAAAYVSKYVTKGDAHMPQGFRRVRTSKDWPKLPPYEGEPFLVPGRKESSLEFILRVHAKTGVDIEELWERYREGWEKFTDLDKGQAT